MCNELQPDVLLIDLIMPELSGVEAIRLIRETCPGIRVVVLTNYKEQDLVYQALQVGALGYYVMKNVPIDELATAVRNVYLGKLTFAPEAAELLIHAVTKPPAPDQDLTGREREVMCLLTLGYNNRASPRRCLSASRRSKTTSAASSPNWRFQSGRSCRPGCPA